jgi:hypothetical protein
LIKSLQVLAAEAHPWGTCISAQALGDLLRPQNNPSRRAAGDLKSVKQFQRVTSPSPQGVDARHQENNCAATKADAAGVVFLWAQRKTTPSSSADASRHF